MSDLNDIVTVVISRETTSVTQAGFGTPAILATFATSKTTPVFPRTRYYSSLTEMVAEGWLTTDDAYMMAEKLLAQNPKVSRFMVARHDSGDATYAAALNAIAAEQSDWYVLLAATVTKADVLAIAAWVEAEKKLYLTRSAEAEVLDPNDVDDIATGLKGLGYERTTVIYHGLVSAVDQYADAAWAGECLPFDPGSQTWAFKTLAGVTADNLTTANANAVFGKNANTYQVKGGVSITREGKVSSGEYIDIIRGLDWLEARLQETIYSLLVNKRKVPYDDSGITLIAAAVDGVLDEAERAGVLIPGSGVVTAPKYADISSANKIARNLPDINFTGLLQGAIQKVRIEGVVSL